MSHEVKLQQCPNLAVNSDRIPPLACRDGFSLNSRVFNGKITYQVPPNCPVIQGTIAQLKNPTTRVDCRNVLPLPSHKDILS